MRIALLTIVALVTVSLGGTPSNAIVTRPIAIATTTGKAPAKPITIKVTAREFSYTLSRKTVPLGATVRFVVRNVGDLPHDFVIAKRRTRLLAPRTSQTLTVKFPKAGTFTFLCSVPGHAKVGMKGRFGVARPVASTPKPAPVDTTSDRAVLTKVGTFARPVLVAAPPGDDRRLFVVEHAGRVIVVKDGVPLETPFLDIRDRVYNTNESGFQSIAFAPDYATSGLVYVVYNQRRGNGDLRLAEYRVSPANPDVLDPQSERVVLEITKPWENHNGGMLQFGPDGMLYLSVGDGDSGVENRPGAFAQSRNELLGDVLRIDPRSAKPYAVPADNPFVGVPDVRPEIWAYGLRNPWRFWIDPALNAMFIGDVGFGIAEEIDAAPLDAPGRNFGWPCLEGTHPSDATATCADPTPPIWDQLHDDGTCSVIAGVVVRDPRLPGLVGDLLAGDYCTGDVFALTIGNPVTGLAASRKLDLKVPETSSFGVDGLNRVYVLSTAGDVFRLDPPPASAG